MDVVGGTFVGGTSQGWSIADPNANAAALGMMPAAAQPLYPTMGFTQPALAQPALGAASLPVYGGGGAGYPSSVYGIGGGTVGGSWSPEPIGNNQILYGHYSATGGLVLPQGATGAAPLATGAAPATTAGGTAAAAPASAPATNAAGAKKAGGAKKPAAAPKADDKKDGAGGGKGKTVTVKSGDTLAKIAAANGIDWKKLYELNKGTIGSDPNRIKPGQTLKLG